MTNEAQKSLAISQALAGRSAGSSSPLEINIELLPDPAAVFATDGKILQVNAAFVQLLEADNQEQLLGKDIYSTGELEEHSQAAVAKLQAGRSAHLEMAAVTLKGNRRHLDIVGLPVVMAGEKVECVMAFARDISALRQAESERALMAALVESSGDAIVSVAPNDTITSWNRRAEEMFGFMQAEAIGQPFLIVVPPQDRPRAKAMVEEVKADRGRVINYEGPALRKDGSLIETSIAVFGIYDRGGKLLGVSSILRDITKRKRAESEQRMLTALVKASEDAIISTALDTSILNWNRGAEQLFGITATQARGRKMLEFVTPQEHARVGAAVAELSRTGKPVSFRLRSLRNDGTVFYSWVNFFPIYNSSGKISAVGAIGRDITDLVEIQDEQASLATIVNASADSIIGFSKELKINSWNPTAENLYGFAAAEAIGRGFDLFVPPEELGAALEADRRVLETGETVTFQQRAQRKDGAWFLSLVNIFPIRDAAGEIIGGAGIGRDITDLVNLQREQALLAAIVESSDDAIVSISSEFRIMTWNKGAQKLFGFTAAEAIGKTNLDLYVPPGERETVTALMREDLAATRSDPAFVRRLEWQGRRKDGSPVDCSMVVSGIQDTSGNALGFSLIMRDISERKRIERELREAQEYTRGLIESSMDAMVIVAPDLRISDGNEQLARLTELPKKVLFGSRFDSYFSEPARAQAAVAQTLAQGYVTNVDLLLKAASGKEIAISFNASLFYRAGKVFGIFGVARDVTQARAIERTLREEREYSRSLVRSSPDALLVSDAALVLTDVNERALQLTSYPREELVGSKLTALFTEPQRAQELLEQARDAGPMHDIELFLLTRNTQEIPVALNVSALREDDGACRRMVVAVRDVSESKRAQKANALLASIVDSSADAIYSESTEMVITSWNPAAERLFGYAAAQVVGHNAALLVPLERRGELAERVRRIRDNRKAEGYETVRLRKDGGTVDVALTQSPILDATGAVTALSVTVRDISERKRLEAEFAKARDAALEAARLKSEFLANMSHEIRTPLNSIIGMTGLLLDTELSPQQSEFAHDVRESGDALLSLVNDILDFSKISAGKLIFEEIDFDLTAMVEGAIELVTSQARSKGLEMTLAVEPEVPRYLHGDPGRLRQVLLNLISNAIKFTEHGEVAVAVSKLSENPQETILRFEVRDSGIGIEQDKLGLLFQPFTQVDASTSRHYGGTGLGLSIARELVQRMHGTIAVTSTPGAGSTFWFTVKLAKQVGASESASERFASMAGASVLIVDDNANSRRILDSQVASWNMKSATAARGAEALTMLRGAAKNAAPYQVALLDVMMPEMDGIELARLIKADPALSATAVVLMSSAGPRTEFKGRLQGIEVDGWLMKPVPQSSLYDCLVKVLAPPAAAVQPAAQQAPATPLKDPATAKVQAYRVLLAEDNPINQKVARLQLKKLGLEVDVAANGREAVEAVMRLPYDVVLMDCQMPEMDGYDATREIRRREAGVRHTMIVAMTAHALPGDRDKCLAAGMDGYVSKPVTQEALQRALAPMIGVSAPPPAAQMKRAANHDENVNLPAANLPAVAPNGLASSSRNEHLTEMVPKTERSQPE